MNETAPPDRTQLPSVRALAQASVVGLLLAGVLLVTVVLPAEVGADPTGVGSWLGLTQLGELKSGGAEPIASVAAPATPLPTAEPQVVAPVFDVRNDELTLTLQPNEGREVKAVMRAGDQLMYSWAAEEGALFYDFHGEPKGAAANVFTSFEKGTQSAAEGGFEAPFDGVHGWYWKNKGSEPVTLVLKTAGVYDRLYQP